MITESMKIQKSCGSRKMFEIEFKFSNFLSIRSKGICLRLSESTAWMGASTTLHGVLRHQRSKQAFAKGNGKNICVKEICKILEIYG